MKLRSEEQTNELKADKTNELEPFKGRAPRCGNVVANHNFKSQPPKRHCDIVKLNGVHEFSPPGAGRRRAAGVGRMGIIGLRSRTGPAG